MPVENQPTRLIDLQSQEKYAKPETESIIYLLISFSLNAKNGTGVCYRFSF